MQQRQDTLKHHHDRTAHDLPPLVPGQLVRVQDHTSGHWLPATTREQCPEPLSYIVETPNVGVLRRNRRHLMDVEPKRVPSSDEMKAVPDDFSTVTPMGSKQHQPLPDKLKHATGQQTTRSGRHVREPGLGY